MSARLPPATSVAPSCLRDVDVAQHALELRSSTRSRRAASSDPADRRRPSSSSRSASLSMNCVLDRLVDEQPRSGRADLALAVEDARSSRRARPRRGRRRRSTMFGDLPPSSSVMCFSVSAARAHDRPCRCVVSPVNAILSMPGCSTIAWPTRRAAAGDDVQHAGRQPDLDRDLAERERGQRRLARRLQDDRVAASRAPARPSTTASSSGKFHGTMAATTPSGSRSV